MGRRQDVPTSGPRQSVNAISAVNPRGDFWYEVYTERLNRGSSQRLLKNFLRGRRDPVLVGTGTSVPAALEMLGRIRAGRARIGRKIVPFLTNVGKPARECHARLGAMVPKVSDDADIATATL